MSAAFTPTHTKFTAEQFQRMGEAGIFGAEDRIELIDGELIDMAPIGSAHGFAVSQLATALVRAVPAEVMVWTQSSTVLGLYSMPQPDLALLRPREESYARAHPRAHDLLLLVEVSDTTLAYDRGRKLALYARYAVAEVWILDVNGRRLEVFRDPAPDGYRARLAFAPGERVAPAALPEAVIDWSVALG